MLEASAEPLVVFTFGLRFVTQAHGHAILKSVQNISLLNEAGFKDQSVVALLSKREVFLNLS